MARPGGKGNSFREPVENRVYVGNLAWGVTWKELKDHMRQAGDVTFCDVMTESSGRSRGCGLVAYRTPEEAERAVATLHDSELLGRLIFVREDREPNGPASKQDCRVYVGNLAWTCTWRDLKDHFRRVGEVTRADVVCEGSRGSGRSKGYGIVEFQTPEEAQRAVEELTDTEIHGRVIFVREDRETGSGPQKGQQKGYSGKGSYKGFGKGYNDYDYDYGYGYCYGGGSGGRFTKVFVGNLPFDCTWQNLKDHMRSAGEIVHVEIMTEGGEANGRSKGNAYVEFSTYGGASRAVQWFHDSMLNGRKILVREYVESAQPHVGSYAKVLVTGFGSNITWQVLKDHMRTAGDVAHVAITPEGGVVTYSAGSLAKRAVERLSGSTLEGEVLTVREM